MIINLGPQHPSTHGVLRLVAELDGEVVRDIHPVIGYLHTGIEKQCENKTYWQGITLVTRMDYLSPFFNIHAYTMSVEKLLDLEVPARAQWLRVMISELNRITSHLVWLGTSGLELGAISIFFYAYRERDRALDLFEMISGERMNHRYFQVGGCADDMPPGFEKLLRQFVTEMPVAHRRVRGPALPEPDLARAHPRRRHAAAPTSSSTSAITGPALRAAGVDLDLRKARPYSGYEHFDFNVPVGTNGDAYDRYLVRLREMRESVRIIEQCLDGMPEGSHIADNRKVVLPPRGELATSMEALIHHFKLVTEGFHRARGRGLQRGRVPAGRARLLRGGRRRPQAGSRPHARPQLREPAGPAADGQERVPRRSHRDDRLDGQRHGRGRPLMALRTRRAENVSRTR